MPDRKTEHCSTKNTRLVRLSKIINGKAEDPLCGTHHASGVERMPTLQTLKGMQTEAIIQSLESGSMRIIGTFELNGPERIAVAEYITGKTYDPNWNIQSQNLCSHDNWDTASIASLLIKPH